MRKIFIFSFIAIALLITGSSALGEGERWIRIGLVQNQNMLEISTANSGEQLFRIVNDTEEQLIFEGTQLSFAWDGSQIMVNNVPVSTGPLIIRPGTSPLSWNLRRYRGELVVTASNGKLNLINRLLLEDYLRGVVPKEVPSGWPLAALKAQAIAARTYTVASFNRHSKEGYDLCALTHCHVYGGADSETPTTDQAVLETANQVIVHNGKVISAAYHAASGGFTKDPATVWGYSQPYLVPVLDWDQNSPYAAWTRTMDWSQVQGVVCRTYPKIGRLNRIIPTVYNGSAYCLKIILKGDLGEITISSEQFRNLFNLLSANIQLGVVYGPDPLIHLWWIPGRTYPEAIVAVSSVNGSMFEILNPPWNQPDPWAWLQDKEPVQLVVKGAGYGHGVGLSQWGAKGMADAGFSERQILEYYYRGVNIISLNDLKK